MFISYGGLGGGVGGGAQTFSAAQGKWTSCSPPGSATDGQTCFEGPQSIKGLSVGLLTEEINKQGINSLQKKSGMDFCHSSFTGRLRLPWKKCYWKDFFTFHGSPGDSTTVLSPSLERWLSFLLWLFRSTSMQWCSCCNDADELRFARRYRPHWWEGYYGMSHDWVLGRGCLVSVQLWNRCVFVSAWVCVC